jgi:hypothetical protein
MSKQPTAGDWHDTAGDSSAAAVARAPQPHSPTDDLNHTVVQMKETMAEAIVAFSSLAKSMIETDAHLQETSERLAAIAQRLSAKQQDVLDALHSNVRRFSTLLFLTLLLATIAASASVVAAFLTLSNTR